MDSAPKKNSTLFHSFKYAFEGIYTALKSETNWKIGFLEAVIVIVAGFYFKITHPEWILVITLIGLVLMAELFNSAIEAIVDSFTTRQHPSAKLAKDFSAGAVVIIIITAAAAGFLIFWPYLKVFLGS